MSCNICAEDYNKVTRGIVVCVYCEFTACRQCCSRYIVDRQEATCMNTDCKKEWSRRFLNENFTKKFFNTEWKAVQEKKCLDKERALFPATMATIEREREEAKVRAEIKPLENEEKITQRKIKDLEQRLYHGDYTDEQIQDIQSEHAALWIRHVDIRRRLQNMRVIQANGGDVASKATYNGRTCSDSNCRGLLSSQWKCATCEKYTCKECHLLKDDNHVCKVEDVETAKLLASDTKPCPKCRVPIHKIMGCDQMWCTECHTAFSWRTGNIETRIHNPHFYEYQRRMNHGQAPRNHGDMECGRTIEGRDGRELYAYMMAQYEYLGDLAAKKVMQTDLTRRMVTVSDKEKLRAMRANIKIFTRMLHLQLYELPIYMTQDVANNEDLRKTFLTRDPSNVSLEDAEKRLKRTVLSREDRRAKHREVYNVGDLLVRTYIDILYRFRDEWREYRKYGLDPKKMDEHLEKIQSYFDELNEIVDYCNELLEDINVTYRKNTNTKCFVIDDLTRDLQDLTQEDVFNGVNVLKLV